MASGILGQAAPSAASNTTVYTVPANITASFTISLLNRDSSNAANVNIAIAAAATPTNAEYLEYNLQLPANGGRFELTGLVAQAGKNVVVSCSNANCSVAVYGYENLTTTI